MISSLARTRAGLRASKRTYFKVQRARQRARCRSIAKMKKRKHILGLKITAKLELDQPLSEFERAYVERKPRSQHTEYAESTQNHGFLELDQISGLERLSEKTPPILFRTFTTTGARHTNGFATSTLYVPSANLMADLVGREGERYPTWIRDSMTDIPLQELRPMLGEHLLWQDRIQDEFLSWTMSYLFATVHLYLRHLDGQGMGYISMINRTRAVHPKKWYLEQSEDQEYASARFHSANTLCGYIKVFDHDWKCRKDLPGLHPRKINHEFITHGVVEYSEDDPLRKAAWSDLVTAGIFKLVPELKVCICSMVAGLYTVLRHIRTSNYNETRTTTESELEIAQRIAWLHTRLQPGEKQEKSRPNLWILLHALTFRKRAAGDQLFRELIRRLGYTLDVQAVVGGQPLNSLVLTSTYSTVSLPEGLDNKDDAAYDKSNKPKLIEKSTKGYEVKRRCGLPCNCSIWGPIRKPKETKKTEQADKSDQSNGADETMIDQTEFSRQAVARLEESAPLAEHVEDEQIQDMDGSEHAESLDK
ncbi:hypothetical protein KCU78_g14288, partial [Aureobasidium melanogenum]